MDEGYTIRNNSGESEKLEFFQAFSYKGNIIKSYRSPSGEVVHIGEGIEDDEFKANMKDYYDAVQQYQKALKR